MLTLIWDLGWENISSLLSELILETLCAGMCILSGEISGQGRTETRDITSLGLLASCLPHWDQNKPGWHSSSLSRIMIVAEIVIVWLWLQITTNNPLSHLTRKTTGIKPNILTVLPPLLILISYRTTNCDVTRSNLPKLPSNCKLMQISPSLLLVIWRILLLWRRWRPQSGNCEIVKNWQLGAIFLLSLWLCWHSIAFWSHNNAQFHLINSLYRALSWLVCPVGSVIERVESEVTQHWG